MKDRLPNDKWIENWLSNRLGEGNVFEQFNRRFCRDLIDNATKLIAEEIFKEIEGAIYWRKDAPYKSTIDPENFNILKEKWLK